MCHIRPTINNVTRKLRQRDRAKAVVPRGATEAGANGAVGAVSNKIPRPAIAHAVVYMIDKPRKDAE